MPTKTDFAATRKQAESDGLLGGGGFYKLKEGDNRFRLLSECLPHTSYFGETKNFKWLCYVIDRRDGAVKPFFMAHKIYKVIEALQTNPDYAFEDVPMPYDLTVNAVQAGTINVVYTVLPSPKHTPVTAVEYQDLAKQKPLAELKQALKDKQAKTNGQATPHVTDEEIANQHGPVDYDEVPPFMR